MLLSMHLLFPDNDYSVASIGEMKLYSLQGDLSLETELYAKNETYSLVHMLDEPSMAKKFVGGVAIQA